MKKIPLTRGYEALVSDEDYEWASRFKWYALGKESYVYAARNSSPDTKQYISLMHREIVAAHPEDVVKHRNGQTLDNTKSNVVVALPGSAIRISPETIRDIFDYDEHTGDLTWTVYVGRRICPGDPVGRVSSSRNNKYKTTQIGRRGYSVHRLIYLWMTGRWPEEFIDHIDGDGLNNRWSNIRPATNSQNQANSLRANKTGFKGVHKKGGKYRASIRRHGEYQYLGIFDTPYEAHEAYVRAANELFGEYAKTA